MLAWVEACSQAEQIRLEAVQCFSDRVIVEASAEPPLRVDIARHGERSFRRAGDAGLSPIGQFEDWNKAPLASRRALDGLTSCVARDAAFLNAPTLEPQRQSEQEAGNRPASPWAWILGTGVLCAALGLGAGLLIKRRREHQRSAPRLEAPPDAEGGKIRSGKRWHASPAWVLALLVTLALLESWAIRAADPDFFMPDPFHSLAIGAVALFSLAAFIPWQQLRLGLMTLAIAVPVGVLFMEWRLATADVGPSRIATSKDLLLRYTYRPGLAIESRGGETITVTEDGLWDEPHQIPKPRDVDRVIVLGDSVPNDPSVPFRNRFPKALEALLAKHVPPGRRIEVVNVSCEGYNTIQEVRLLEKVGLRYEPDLVVLAYVLNDPFLQNGGYRRIGNSFFAFRFLNLVSRESSCPLFERMHEGYTFDLVVRASLERLRPLADKGRFQVLVAPLPLVQPFEDPSCLASYDKVVRVAEEQGFAAARVVDAFRGEDHHRFLKPEEPSDITHPNAEGHERIARRLSELVVPMLWGEKAQ